MTINLISEKTNSTSYEHGWHNSEQKWLVELITNLWFPFSGVVYEIDE